MLVVTESIRLKMARPSLLVGVRWAPPPSGLLCLVEVSRTWCRKAALGTRVFGARLRLLAHLRTPAGLLYLFISLELALATLVCVALRQPVLAQPCLCS